MKFVEQLKMRWNEIAPKVLRKEPKRLEIEAFDRDDAEVIAEGTGCEGVSIIEHDGDRFRIEERANGNNFIVATTRNKRIFKCRKCGGLDAVDTCRFCKSTDIAIFVLSDQQ